MFRLKSIEVVEQIEALKIWSIQNKEKNITHTSKHYLTLYIIGFQ